MILLIALTILFVACGSDDKSAELKKLEAQRNALDSQISVLRSELSAAGNTRQEAIYSTVALVKIQPQPFVHSLRIQGNIESDNNILIPARVSGIVKKIYVRQGDRVQAVQLLAELDGVIYEKSIEELEINLELATTVFEKQKRLWEKEIGSEIQYLQAKTNKEGLEKKLATVREQYELTKIKSPISGTVDDILIRENEGTAAGFGTIRVVNFIDLKIKAHVSESNIGRLKKGDPVQVDVPVVGKSFTSKIQSVSQVIDATNRTFSIEIGVPVAAGEIRPNMMTVLNVQNYENPAALTVPINTVQRTENSNFLFLAKLVDSTNGFWQIERREVKTGLDNDKNIEITEGLLAGEFVVTTGFQDLADGQMVKVPAVPAVTEGKM